MNPLIVAGALAAAVVLGTVGRQSQAEERVPLADVSHIHGIAVDPADPQRLYLATHFGVWLAFPDGTAEQISDNSNDYMGFSRHPREDEVFFASGHPATGGNMGVIVSRDGARTWQQLASGVDGPVDFHAMDVSPADPDVIYGYYGRVQVSRDGGRSWEIAGSPPADVFDLAASALNPDIVYAATRNGLMISLDGGRNWDPTGPAGAPASMVQTAPDGAIYAFVLGSGLIRAPAEALVWQSVSNSFGNQILLHLAFDPGNPDRMFAVTDRSEILTSSDGGESWAAVGS